MLRAGRTKTVASRCGAPTRPRLRHECLSHISLVSSRPGHSRESTSRGDGRKRRIPNPACGGRSLRRARCAPGAAEAQLGQARPLRCCASRSEQRLESRATDREQVAVSCPAKALVAYTAVDFRARRLSQTVIPKVVVSSLAAECRARGRSRAKAREWGTHRA